MVHNLPPHIIYLMYAIRRMGDGNGGVWVEDLEKKRLLLLVAEGIFVVEEGELDGEDATS